MNSNIGISIGWINSCGIRKGPGLFCVKGLRDGTKYIHLCYWVIIAEDAVEVSIFDAISEIKEKW